MTTWYSLRAAALLGTERQSYQSKLLPSDARSEVQILSDVAALCLQRKAGHLPDAHEVSEAIAPSPIDKLPSASLSSHLRTMLEDRDYEKLLKEWLEQLHQANKRLPVATLPDILDHGSYNPELRPAIASVLGNRGNWLAHFKPSWHWVKYCDDALANISREELVENIWPKVKAETRMDLLVYFEKNFENVDETFLEVALNDVNKYVRAKAASLLSCLPNSDLSKRMCQRTDTLLQLKKQGRSVKLELELIKNLSEDLKSDGILQEQKVGEGKKASLTRQVLEYVPLDYLTSRLEQDPSKLIDLASKSEDWAGLLLGAWLKRTLLEKNIQWAQIFFEKRSKLKKHIDEAELAELFRLLLNGEEREQYLLKQVKKQRSPLYKTELMLLLSAHDSPWSKVLTERVLEHFEQDLLSIKNYTPKFQQLYIECIYHMHPTTVQVLLQAITLPLETANWLDNMLAQMRDISDIRYAIYEEF